MISRRNFLKLSGLSAAALGAGYSTGKLIGNNKTDYFSVHGFIPADEKIISSLIASFKRKVKSSTVPFIDADEKIKRIVHSADKSNGSNLFSNKGRIEYRIHKINENLDSDIIISDNKSSVYSPEDDFNVSFADIRNRMKNRKAEYLFTAEYKEENIFPALFADEKKIIVENERGVSEKISLTKDFKNIQVKGAIGETELSVKNGIIKVNSSCCRNKICTHTFISQPGQIIACAPNKILIHFEA